METELTKKMKCGLVRFRPEMPTNMRTIRYAEEVWTPTGIVDLIRFEDYKEKEYSFCALIDFDQLAENDKIWLKNTCGDNIGKCKLEGFNFPNEMCKSCVFKRNSYEVGMLVTCFECKITLSDFKSKNGHNFCGNKNYYVVPIDLYSKVREMVSAEIGIIAYYPETNNYRVKKECSFQKISHEQKERLLYDAMKKWVDKFSSKYFSDFT